MSIISGKAEFSHRLEEATSTTQLTGMLKEYLEGLKKEVVSTMMLLFD